MNTLRKIFSIIWAVIAVALSYIMIKLPDVGHIVIVFVIAAGLILLGVKYLFFYFRMAIHMVGGKRIFYYGVMCLSLGVFTASLYDIPQIYIMIYLLGICLFLGFISIMRALEMKKMESRWELKFFEGIGYILVAIVGIIFIQSTLATSIIYCAGLVYSAVMQMVSSFRRTAIVYIQ